LLNDSEEGAFRGISIILDGTLQSLLDPLRLASNVTACFPIVLE
jgi:hypothetical protein